MADPVNVTRDARQMPQLAPDPDVQVPESVRRASAAADAIHQQAYGQPQDPNAAPQPAPTPGEAPITDPFDMVLNPQSAPPAAPAAPAPAPQPEAPPQPEPAPAAPAAAEPEFAPFDPNITAEQYHHRLSSMHGRWRASQAQLGEMQGMMAEMSDALARAPAPPTGPSYPMPDSPASATLLTPEDTTNFGPELIDLATRAAKQALAPEINAVKAENARLSQQVKATGVQAVYAELDRAVPSWREINVSAPFKAWLGLRDLYSGHVRRALLNAAFGAADAPRVVAFFQGFVRDGIATGSIPQPQAEPAPQPQPREPAMSLEMLASPGRATPGQSDTSATPTDKPVFTRAQIKQFYEDVRRGGYAGREADKNRIEQAIFAAQREGRVRN
jgi:hypothetical protein